MLADVPWLAGLLSRHLLPTDGDDETRARVFVRRVATHGLVAYAEQAVVEQQWPAAVFRELAERRRAEAHHALQLAYVLRTLSTACDGAGIDLLTMKGVALSSALHGDVSRRGTRDVDVLIDPASFGTVAAVLLDMGSVPDDPWCDWTPRQFAAHATTSHEFGFHTPSGVCIEVHTRLTTMFIAHAPSFHELWRRRRMVSVAGRDVPTLAWPDTAVHLATHGFRHAWERLVWLCDIAHLMARQDVDWEEAEALARRRHEHVALTGAILAAHDVLGARVPAGVTAPRRAVSASRAVEARIARGALHPTGVTMLADHWRSRDSTIGALSYLWRVATTMTPADCAPGEPWPPTRAARWWRRPTRLVRRYLVGPGAPSVARPPV